ncbi:MAG: hypothetical protein RLZZ231_430 [Bacteroidota bacterium]
MKSVPTLLLLFVFSILVASCDKYDAKGRLIKEYEELEKARFLIGTWEKKDSLGVLKEQWQVENDSTFTAVAYFIQNEKDTLHFEQIELVENNNILIYTATIKGENNDLPVPFQMTEAEDSLVVFKNPKHDFPQQITYRLQKNNTLKATVSGTQFGKKSSNEYLFIKK